MDCVFCSIANKSMPAKIFYEDEDVLVIQDILPKAPVHMLAITHKHIPSLAGVGEQDEQLLGKMVIAAKKAAAGQGIADTGYKLMFNVGNDGGQIIPHIHLHILGGKKIPE